MKTLVYDNPDTMDREAWQNGHLLCKVSMNMLNVKDFYGHPGMPFMLDVGEWETGKVHQGSLEAKEKINDQQ